MSRKERPSSLFAVCAFRADTAPVPIDIQPFEQQHLGAHPRARRANAEPDNFRQLQAGPLLRITQPSQSLPAPARMPIDLVTIEGATLSISFAQHREPPAGRRAPSLHRQIEPTQRRREFPDSILPPAS